MIDCHIHILPKSDDGAKNIKEALAMAKTACDSGVTKMIVTPHANHYRYQNYNDEKLKQTFNQFKAYLEGVLPQLEIYLGMEIYVTNDLIKKIENNEVIGLNNSRYYLIEFDFDINIDKINRTLKEILALDKIPVIAHPERYKSVQIEPWVVFTWLEMGCLTQLNKDSIFGMFGKTVQVTAKKLLDYNLVSLVASDSHENIYRLSNMDEIQDFLELNYGLDYSFKLLYDHPLAIINNDDILFER